MQAVFVQTGKMIDYTPNAAVAAGAVVVQGVLVGVAERAIAANAVGALTVEGVFDIQQTAIQTTAGQAVYWDADATNVAGTTGGLVENPALGPFAGFVVTGGTTTDQTLRVNLRSAESATEASVVVALTKSTGSTAGATNEEVLAASAVTEATGSTVGATNEETLLSPNGVGKAAGTTTGGTYIMLGSTVGDTAMKTAADSNFARLSTAISTLRNDNAKLVAQVNNLRNDTAKIVRTVNQVIAALKAAGLMATS